MGMIVYKSNRGERLADELAGVLRTSAADPCRPELVVVHGAVVARWLALELSRRLGVFAGVRFARPEEVVEELLGAVLGREAAEAAQRWRPEWLRWAVLDALPDALGREGFAPLAAALRGDPSVAGEQAIRLAGGIAATFNRAALHRPGTARRWARGEGGEGWQAELFAAVASRAGAASPAELVPELIGRLEDGTPREALATVAPPRVSLFAVVALAPMHARVFAALARHVDVHVFVLSPAAGRRADVAALASAIRPWARGPGDDDPPAVDEARLEGSDGLLASMGRPSRDTHAVLAALAGPGRDLHVAPRARTMLAVLQRDVLRQRRRGAPGVPRPWRVAPGDRSITVHACHGPRRQVEVLRDQIHAALDEIPGLAPRDVVVMTPDIDAYAPLVEAVFDAPPGDPLHLPIRIADRSPRRTSQAIEVLLRVIDLVGTRVTGPDVLDLLALEPVRRRFSMTVDDLERVIEWVGEAGVRWGIDTEHRVRHGQPPYAENTWRFGLDRLLLGFAAPGRGRWLFNGTLPYDEVEGGAGALLGQLVEFCERLFATLAALERGPRSMAAWRDTLVQALTGLVDAAVPAAAEAGVAGAREALDALAREAGGSTAPLELSAVRALLEERFGAPDDEPGSPGPPPPGAGPVTFYGMVPLRSLPARVVCLLGMDDGALSRPRPRPGPRPLPAAFDPTLRERRIGDRTDRDDDRQLVLDALLGARDRFVVLYSGRSERNDQPLPPASVVSELLDVLAASFVPDAHAQGEAIIDHVVTHHPLQAFSPRCFGASHDDRLFTYAAAYLDGARALLRASEPPLRFVDGPLVAAAYDRIALEALLEFFDQPVRSLLERRLGIRFAVAETLLADREPVALSALDRHRLAAPLLERRLAGEDPAGIYAAARAAGLLPWGVPGRCEFDDLVDEVAPLAAAVVAVRGEGGPRPPVAIDLPVGGLRLVGRLDGVCGAGRIVHQPSLARARHLLRLWISHLVLCCDGSCSPSESTLVSRLPAGEGAVAHRLVPPPSPAALLEQLVALYRVGLAAPLLFFPETSLAYVRELERCADLAGEAARRRAVDAAVEAWAGSGAPGAAPGEGADPALQRVFGSGVPPLRDAAPPGRGFHELALAVWGPVLEHLSEVRRWPR